MWVLAQLKIKIKQRKATAEQVGKQKIHVKATDVEDSYC